MSTTARPRPPAKPLPAWPIPLLIVGVLGAVIVVCIFAFESRRLVEHGSVAEGEVIDIDYLGSDSGIPLVRFAAGQGSTTVRLANPLGRGYHEGQRIQVRFDPQDPQRARQDDFAGLWAQPIIATGVGIAVLAATIVFAVLRRRSLQTIAVTVLLGACRNEASAEDEDEGPMCSAQECDRSADCDSAVCVWMDPSANDCAPPAGDEGSTCPCVKACAQCLPLDGLGCVDDAGCCEGVCALAEAVPGEAACVPECSSDADCAGSCVARRCVD